MKKEKKLEKIDELVFKLYMKSNIIGDADYIIEQDSVREDEEGTRFVISVPTIEYINNRKVQGSRKRRLLITNKGNIETLSEKRILTNDETLDDFVNNVTYKIEECTEDLIRMTKEKHSITYSLDGNSLKKVKTTTPSILYLNSFGQVLDIITLDKRPIDKPKTYTR